MADLPLTIEGRLISFPAPRIWSEMCYPDDRLAALRAWEQISIENLAMQNDLQHGYSRIAKLIQKDMNRSTKLGKLCGYVACQMRWNYQKRGAVLKERACFAVSEYYSGEKTVSGKSIPTDEKRLRETVNMFAPVLHLWAAFVLLEESEGRPENILEGENAFDALIILALDMQNFIRGSGAFTAGNSIYDNLLMVPTELSQQYENYVVSFPEEPDWVERILTNYVANASR